MIASAASTAIAAVAGVDDDDGYTIRVARRIARRTARPGADAEPGILFLEIDGLALPVLRRAIRDGTTPTMARWLAEGSHRLLEWETDLSSQTGASQAGILLGDNEDIPAFRWVDKQSKRIYSCSNPDDCAEIERTHSRSPGLLAGGGTSRGNLLSGGADAAILTASRVAEEKRTNPGYRAFLANGSNVTRTLVLAIWEVWLELVAAARQRRRDVRPRGHRGGIYPLLRAGMCVFVRDLVVFSLLQDMFRGVPAVYATFASYDEVAHHSGLERPDTLEALCKLDDRFGLIERARRYAPRPYEIVVLSDHGQTQGATFRQRNGYGLDELVRRSISEGRVDGVDAGDENAGGVGRAMDEATGRRDAQVEPPRRKRARGHRPGVRQPRAHLPHDELASTHARADPGAASAAHPGAVRPSPHRVRARALKHGRAGRDRRPRHPPARGREGDRGGPTRRLSARTPLGTCGVPTASRTCRTSSSTASTTRSARRAARSRS